MGPACFPRRRRGWGGSGSALLLRQERQSETVFNSFYLPAEASAQAGKKKGCAPKLKTEKTASLSTAAWRRAEPRGGSIPFKVGSYCVQ